MKKQLRIVLTFLLVAAFFITAEIVPEITNHLTDQKTTNTITVSHGSTQTTPTKVNLSYKERLAIFSSETIAVSEILTTSKSETLTEYDESFFEKLQKQLHKLYSFHLWQTILLKSKWWHTIVAHERECKCHQLTDVVETCLPTPAIHDTIAFVWSIHTQL